jgi:hypothetical protein
MSDKRKNLVTNSQRRKDYAKSSGKKLVDGIPQDHDTLTGLEKSFSDLFTKMETYEKSGQSNADARRALMSLTTGIKRQLMDSLGGTRTQSRSSGSTKSRSTKSKGKGKSKTSSSSTMDGIAPTEPRLEHEIRSVIERSTGSAASSDGAGEQGGSDIPDYSWINNFTPNYSLEMFEAEMRSLSKDTSPEQVRKLLGVFEAFGTSLALDAASMGKSKAKAKAKSKSKTAGTSTDPPASLSLDARMFLSRPPSDSDSPASSAQSPHLSLHSHPLAGLLMWARDGTLDEATIEEGSAVEETDHEETDEEE